jgi:hypothetical protein
MLYGGILLAGTTTASAGFKNVTDNTTRIALKGDTYVRG